MVTDDLVCMSSVNVINDTLYDFKIYKIIDKLHEYTSERNT